MREFDLFVIGGGSGGVRAARVAAGHGAKVALAERDRLGGTCVIRGCVPKKLMVLASRFAEEFDLADAYGWRIAEPPRLDWPTLKLHRDREIARLEGVYAAGLANSGVTVFRDHASLLDPRTVELRDSGERIGARHLLVATGSAPNPGRPIPGIELACHSDALFDWPDRPQRVLIQGGGYIAAEYACLLQRLGSQVTLVYRGRHILSGFDDDLRQRLQAQMTADGIDVLTEATVAAIERTAGGKRATLSSARTIDCDEVLFAIGRSPLTAGLGLERAGVACDAHGAVVVDVYSRSNLETVHAVGDVTNRVNLTPVAIREGHAFADTVFGGAPTAVDHSLVPSAVFTTPELGTVGLTEAAALAMHPRLDVYRSEFRPLKATLAPAAPGSPRTFMKLLVDRDSDRVLGAHMLGPEAGEMAQLLGVALRLHARKADLDATLAVHPTAAEEWVTMRTPTMRHTS